MEKILFSPPQLSSNLSKNIVGGVLRLVLVHL